MSAFALLIMLVIHCIEVDSGLFHSYGYQIPKQVSNTREATEKPYNSWDSIYRKNWTSFMNIHVQGNTRYYINSDFKASYIEAVMFCEEMNMQLVSIESSDENDVLYKHIRDANRGDTFWTSGSKLLDAHHWVWMSKFDSVSYTNWKIGEPSNPNEHCIALTHVKGNGLLWNDWDCNAKLYFVCEKDLSSNSIDADDTENGNKNRLNGIFQESSVSPNIALLHFENKSYFVGRYMKATYVEALRLCTMVDMRLVSINSMGENNILYKYIRDTNAGDKFWSSGSKLIDGKTWIWMANAQPVYYTNWGKNEPDNPSHLCIQLDNLKNDGLFWNDYECGSKNYYICEKPRYFPQISTTTTTTTDFYQFPVRPRDFYGDVDLE